jgi:metal-responsive CopG/Arc/MetJ family transcriptional regulator
MLKSYCYKNQDDKATARVPVALSKNALCEIDLAATNLGLNRSAFIKMAIQAQLKAIERHG